MERKNGLYQTFVFGILFSAVVYGQPLGNLTNVKNAVCKPSLPFPANVIDTAYSEVDDCTFSR